MVVAPAARRGHRRHCPRRSRRSASRSRRSCRACRAWTSRPWPPAPRPPRDDHDASPVARCAAPVAANGTGHHVARTHEDLGRTTTHPPHRPRARPIRPPADRPTGDVPAAPTSASASPSQSSARWATRPRPGRGTVHMADRRVPTAPTSSLPSRRTDAATQSLHQSNAHPEGARRKELPLSRYVHQLGASACGRAVRRSHLVLRLPRSIRRRGTTP